MRQDESGRRSSLDATESASSSAAVPSRVMQTRDLARQLLPQASPDKRQEIKNLLTQMDEAIEFEDNRSQIEAASQALEPHRAEFEALLKDWQAAADRAHVLFAKKQFAPMWFTVQDIQRAFEAVGYPPHIELDERTAKVMADAILHIADKERRQRDYVRLMSLVPDYLSAGRFVDAWLIQYCAFLTVDTPKKSNPFLAEMFLHGFGEWAKQADAQQESVVREMGLDPAQISQMGVDELEAWVQSQMADPTRKAQLEDYLKAHPTLRDQMESDVMEMERGAALLLEREDAGVLYLAPEEVEPWMPRALERMQASKERLMKVTRSGKPTPAATRAASDLLVSLSREMTRAIFAPERVNQLVGVLKDYRRRLLAANEKQSAAYTQGAIMMLEHETDATENPFLNMICFASLRAMLKTLSEQAQARGKDETEPGQL